ncbi:MAG: hypothetical protein WHF31_16405 [Candidatus Dehalobacter alkaniphilus]
MKEGMFSKLVIIAVIALNIVFTAIVLWIFLKTSVEPTTLIGCWFGFTTVEMWSLASIKKAKVKKKEEQNHE